MGWVPPPPDHEPHRVLIHKGEFVDHGRAGRVVPYKIYYPVAHGLAHLPVVVWSHGLGGTRDGAAFLARFIASHGYVVINIQHAGSDSAIWEGKPGHPWDVIRATPISRRTSLDRFYDVPFLMECLPDLIKEHPEIGEHMDLGNAGIAGHSFGALTAQVMAGELFPDEQDKLIRIGVDKFRAGILYSFIPVSHITKAPPEELLGGIKIPLLFMTGTDDQNPLTGQGYEFRLPVYQHAGCREKHLLVLEDGDHMVFAGSRGKLEENPKRHRHEQIIKIASLAFWDAYLKDDAGAKAWLTGAGIASYLEGEAKHEYQKR